MVGQCFPGAVITSLTLVSLVSSELYHIVPTDSPSLCVNYTADSCMSLAQFAGRYVTSNDSALTLVFSPGEHTLSQIIHISNIHNVTLIGDSEQLTVINYVGESGFKMKMLSILYVTNLNMRRDGQTVLDINNVESVLIKKCQVTGRKEPKMSQFFAAVVIFSAVNISVSKSDFENNKILNPPVTIQPYDAIGGPALQIDKSHSFLVEASSFTNNSLRGISQYGSLKSVGGAILLGQVQVATLINCTLKKQHSTLLWMSVCCRRGPFLVSGFPACCNEFDI